MSGRHDTAYKALFSYPTFVQQLIQGFAPPELSQHLDFSTLTNLSGNYVTPALKQKLQDVVWSLKWKGDANASADIYLCLLLEFQSKIDHAMPLRVLNYVASFYHQLAKQQALNLKQDKLPLVLPFVLYNGNTQWTAPLSIQQTVQRFPRFLKPFQPHLSYFLVDQTQILPNELVNSPHPLSSVFEMEKAARSEQLKAIAERLIAKANRHPDRPIIVKAILEWLQYYLNYKGFDINLNTISQLEELPTMLDLNKERQEWKQEGVLLGLEQGIERGTLQSRIIIAKRLLQTQSFNNQQIAELTDLTLEQVEQLRAQSAN